jgi:hypothetical protein
MVYVERAIGSKIILGTTDELLGDVGQMELILVYLGTALILAQDRCTIHAECTMAWKSFWPHPMELLGDGDQMEARFSLFGAVVNLDTR